MDKCKNCGREIEGIFLQGIWVGRKSIQVCPECYAKISRDNAEKEYYEEKKRKLGSE